VRQARSTATLFFAAAVLALASPATAAPLAAAPKRIVSMNLCVDQYLMVLADPGQIGALSRFARDPDMSFYAREARSLPISRSTVEEVLALRPDMIFASPYRSKTAFAPLERKGVPVLEVGGANTFEEIIAQTRMIAAAVGHPERGEALIARMRSELAQVEARPKAAGVAAYYQRRGFLTGEGTLVDEIMRRAGLTNLATQLKLGPISRLPLESIVKARPDYLILEADAVRQPDNGAQMLFHPALERVVPAGRRLVIPQPLTVCGGPFYAQAVESLRSQALAAALRPH
jgi:iron complex transport system substrate-binding protein